MDKESRMRPDEPAPVQPVELNHAEHLVLRAVRAFVVGRGDCLTLRHTLAALCGPRTDQTLCALMVAVRLLALRSRRRLRVHLPGCGVISADELMLLSALAATQGRDGLPAGGGAGLWLSRLTGAPADACLCAAFEDVGRLLAMSGQRLTIQDLEAEADRPAQQLAPAARTLH